MTVSPGLIYGAAGLLAVIVGFMCYILLKGQNKAPVARVDPAAALLHAVEVAETLRKQIEAKAQAETEAAEVPVAERARMMSPDEALEECKKSYPDLDIDWGHAAMPCEGDLEQNSVEEADRLQKVASIKQRLNVLLGDIGYYDAGVVEEEEPSGNGHKSLAQREEEDKLNARSFFARQAYTTPVGHLAELTYLGRKQAYEFALMETIHVAGLIAQLELLGEENTTVWLPTVYRCSFYRHMRSVGGMHLMGLRGLTETALGTVDEDSANPEEIHRG